MNKNRVPSDSLGKLVSPSFTHVVRPSVLAALSWRDGTRHRVNLGRLHYHKNLSRSKGTASHDTAGSPKLGSRGGRQRTPKASTWRRAVPLMIKVWFRGRARACESATNESRWQRERDPGHITKGTPRMFQVTDAIRVMSRYHCAAGRKSIQLGNLTCQRFHSKTC